MADFALRHPPFRAAGTTCPRRCCFSMATSECTAFLVVPSAHTCQQHTLPAASQLDDLTCASLLTVSRCIADTPGTGGPTAQRSCSGCAGTTSRSWDTPASGIGVTPTGGCLLWELLQHEHVHKPWQHMRWGVPGHCMCIYVFDSPSCTSANRDCGTVEFGKPCWRLGSFATPREPEVSSDRQQHACAPIVSTLVQQHLTHVQHGVTYMPEHQCSLLFQRRKANRIWGSLQEAAVCNGDTWQRGRTGQHPTLMPEYSCTEPADLLTAVGAAVGRRE